MKQEWDSRPFEECIDPVIYTAKVQRKDFLSNGVYPIVSQEDAFINGFWNQETDLFRVERPIIVFGDHTRVLKYVEFDFVLGADGVKILKPKTFLYPKFLYYQLYTAKLNSLGYARHYRLLKEHLVTYPAYDEQERIVAILDEAFEGVATAKANTEKNLQNAQRILEGRLAQTFSQPSADWKNGVLRDLTSKSGSGATPLGGEAAYKQDGISLVRSLNVYDRGFRYERLAFIDEGQARRLANVQLQVDDVLLNITGASVARCCVIPVDVLPARVNQHVSIVRPLPNVLESEFLHWLLIAPPNKERLLGIGTGAGATRQAITKAEIEAFEIRYPSYEQQKQIATEIADFAEATDQFGDICSRKLIALDEMKKSMLHQAFTGKL